MARISKVTFLSIFAVCLINGCGGDSADLGFRLNEVEFLRQEKISLPEGKQYPDHYRTEILGILEAIFGTPDLPMFAVPDNGEGAPVAIENLNWSAGRVHSDIDGRPISGLYREHCAHCHGINGSGAGPSAAFLNPYPRDLRRGKFKFKSTPLRKAPTDHDLERILKNGIPGTAMPSFKTLPDEEIHALVDYVKYLSIRGEFERLLMSELSTLQGEPILDVGDLSYQEIFAANKTEELPPEIEDQLSYLVDELLAGVINRWQNPDQFANSIPAPPDSLDPDHSKHRDLVAKGRQIYFARGNCAQCHGDTAMGDALTVNYDDWTNDWIKTAGVDPTNRDTFRDFKRAGALKPRPVRPRNLRMAFYRGGTTDEDLYRRILYGIEGTPMPAGTTLSTEEIWALVAFVRWLPKEKVNDSSAYSHD